MLFRFSSLIFVWNAQIRPSKCYCHGTIMHISPYRPIKVHAQLPTIYTPIRLFSWLLELATLFSIVIFNHFNGEIELRLRIIIFKFKNNVLCSMENYGVIIIIYLIGTIFTFSATNSISSFFFIVCRITGQNVRITANTLPQG